MNRGKSTVDPSLSIVLVVNNIQNKQLPDTTGLWNVNNPVTHKCWCHFLVRDCGSPHRRRFPTTMRQIYDERPRGVGSPRWLKFLGNNDEDPYLLLPCLSRRRVPPGNIHSGRPLVIRVDLSLRRLMWRYEKISYPPSRVVSDYVLPLFRGSP